MRLLAQHGSRCNWLHQAVPDMHWVQQRTSWDTATWRGPSQTLGKNRCWLLSRPFGEKAPNSGRLLQQVPVCVSSGIHTSFQDHYSPKGTLCSWRHTRYHHVWQWTSLQWEKSSGSFPVTLTSCTPHHHPISISWMDSLRQWWRKSKMPTRRWMDPPVLRLEHYSSYVTHLSQQTSHPQQRSYMVVQLKAQSFQDHPRGSTYVRSGKDWLNSKRSRKKTSTEPIEPKICIPSKSRNKSSSSTTNKAPDPIKWMTGTVTKILECGRSYMIQAPNGRVYRRNRAHLKPICHNGSSFQDHPVKKGKKQPKDNSFQDHQTSQARSVSFDNEVSYMDTWSMMFDEPDTRQTPPTPLSCSPPASSPPKAPLT